MIVLQKMLVLFLIMLTGYAACKKDILTEPVRKKLSGVIVNIANPCIILSAVLDGDLSVVKSSDVFLTMGVSWVVYGVLFVIAEIIPRLLLVPKKEFSMYRVMTVFSNMGYMGFPILLSVYGNTALLYASIFLIPFNFLIYTYGVLTMKKKGEKGGFKIKAVFNNGVLACILMILLFFTGIKIPQVLCDTITSIAGMTVPVSMMIIGAALAEIRLADLFTDVRLLLFAVLRLMAVPIIGMQIVTRLITQTEIAGVTLVVLATPVGSLVAMLAQEYDGDYMLASKGVALTTMLSVITIPVVFAVTGL